MSLLIDCVSCCTFFIWCDMQYLICFKYQTYCYKVKNHTFILCNSNNHIVIYLTPTGDISHQTQRNSTTFTFSCTITFYSTTWVHSFSWSSFASTGIGCFASRPRVFSSNNTIDLQLLFTQEYTLSTGFQQERDLDLLGS